MSTPDLLANMSADQLPEQYHQQYPVPQGWGVAGDARVKDWEEGSVVSVYTEMESEFDLDGRSGIVYGAATTTSAATDIMEETEETEKTDKHHAEGQHAEEEKGQDQGVEPAFEQQRAHPHQQQNRYDDEVIPEMICPESPILSAGIINGMGMIKANRGGMELYKSKSEELGLLGGGRTVRGFRRRSSG